VWQRLSNRERATTLASARVWRPAFALTLLIALVAGWLTLQPTGCA